MEIQSLLKLIGTRQSCRSYIPGKEIPEELMRNCLEAARLAPSSCNKQPWRFIIVRNREMIRRIAGEGLLPGIKMTWLNDASAIAVLCAETNVKVHWLAPILSGIQYHLVDLGIAGEHFCLAAEAQGLGTCWIGWFKPKAVAQMLGIPSGIQPTALISVGYLQKDGAIRFNKLPRCKHTHYRGFRLRRPAYEAVFAMQGIAVLNHFF